MSKSSNSPASEVIIIEDQFEELSQLSVDLSFQEISMRCKELQVENQNLQKCLNEKKQEQLSQFLRQKHDFESTISILESQTISLSRQNLISRQAISILKSESSVINEQNQVLERQKAIIAAKMQEFTENSKSDEQQKLKEIRKCRQTLESLRSREKSDDNKISFWRSDLQATQQIYEREHISASQLETSLNEQKYLQKRDFKILQRKIRDSQDITGILCQKIQESSQHLQKVQKNLCFVCRQLRPTMGVYPCGHIIYCESCISKVGTECLLCKTRVVHKFRFYQK